MDYKELIDILRDETNPNVLDYIDDAVTAINDLLARAESAEARAEKAERERNTYKIFFDDISKKPDCNTCSKKECEYRPGIGKTTRFNCPLWRGLKEE